MRNLSDPSIWYQQHMTQLLYFRMTSKIPPYTAIHLYTSLLCHIPGLQYLDCCRVTISFSKTMHIYNHVRHHRECRSLPNVILNNRTYKQIQSKTKIRLQILSITFFQHNSLQFQAKQCGGLPQMTSHACGHQGNASQRTFESLKFFRSRKSHKMLIFEE